MLALGLRLGARVLSLGAGEHAAQRRRRIAGRRLGLAARQLWLARTGGGTAEGIGLVHLAGLAARVLDALALAQASAAPAHLGAIGLRAGQPARLRRHGWVRSRVDAGPAAAGRAGGVRAAHLEAQHRRGDRLVLGLLLHHRGSRSHPDPVHLPLP